MDFKAGSFSHKQHQNHMKSALALACRRRQLAFKKTVPKSYKSASWLHVGGTRANINQANGTGK